MDALHALHPSGHRWPARLHAGLLGVAGLLAGSGAALAQPVYRIVEPNGRVTFSDRPPPASAPGQARAQGGIAAEPVTSTGPALPYPLQQVANRFPVTLYTGADCAPCDSARLLLSTRGVPFAERTVRTDEDFETLKRLSGDTSLPFGSIGAQQLKGFSDLEWTQFLDAAGYPKTSQLPPRYRGAAPTPLVAVRVPPPAAPASAPGTSPAARQAAPPAAAAPAPAPANPAGITF